MADLEDLIPTLDTIEMIVKHPVTDEPLLKDDGTEMSITLYATHSKQYKDAIHEQTDLRIKKASKGKKVTFTAEDIEKGSLDLLVKTTKEWDLQFGKKDLKFSQDTARDIYTKIEWLKQQALEAQEEYDGFLKT